MREPQEVNSPLTVTRDTSATPEQVWAVIADGWTYSQWVVGNSRMRAVDAVMECLKAEGVDVVFGLPGGANLPTYDAFVDAGIHHVLVRHEAGGGHAASTAKTCSAAIPARVKRSPISGSMYRAGEIHEDLA